jgi:hypothetical protein
MRGKLCFVCLLGASSASVTSGGVLRAFVRPSAACTCANALRAHLQRVSWCISVYVCAKAAGREMIV